MATGEMRKQFDEALRRAGFNPADVRISTAGPPGFPVNHVSHASSADDSAFDWVRLSRDEPRKRIASLPEAERRLIEAGQLVPGNFDARCSIKQRPGTRGVSMSAELPYVDLGWWHYQTSRWKMPAVSHGNCVGYSTRMPPPGDVFVAASKQHIFCGKGWTKRNKTYVYVCHVQRRRQSPWDQAARVSMHCTSAHEGKKGANTIAVFPEVEAFDEFIAPYTKLLVDAIDKCSYLMCTPPDSASIACLRMDLARRKSARMVRGRLSGATLMRENVSWTIVGPDEFLLVAAGASDEDSSFGHVYIRCLFLLWEKNGDMRFEEMASMRLRGLIDSPLLNRESLHDQWHLKRLRRERDDKLGAIAIARLSHCPMQAIAAGNDSGTSSNTTPYVVYDEVLDLDEVSDTCAPFCSLCAICQGRLDVGGATRLVAIEHWPSAAFARCICGELVGQYRNWTIVYCHAVPDKLGQFFAVRRLHSRDNPERPPTVVLLEIAPDVAAEMERLVKAIPKMSEFLGYANVCISTNNRIIVSARFEYPPDEQQGQRFLTLCDLGSVLNRRCGNCDRRTSKKQQLLVSHLPVYLIHHGQFVSEQRLHYRNPPVCRQCKIEKRHKSWWKFRCHFCNAACFRANWAKHKASYHAKEVEKNVVN